MQSDRDLIELRFTRAYIELFAAPINAGGEKIASLVRFGKYEVRLIRLARASLPLPCRYGWSFTVTKLNP